MKTNKIFILSIFILILTINLGSSFIIDQHITINKAAISQTQGSQITSLVSQYEDYFHACNQGTDISVVSYFTIDSTEEDGFFDKLFKVFTFNIGKSYRSSHSQNACLRAVSVAENDKELVCGYAICAHLMADTVSHNKGVPAAIEKTHLWNGLVHSIKEIHDKDLFATPQDTLDSRQTLDLLYEMTPYFEKVFVNDPGFSDVDIPAMIDFFVKEVQPQGEYQLGFRSFFALPKYIYWMVLLLFVASLTLLGLTVRKIRDKQIDTATVFTLIFSLSLFSFISVLVYGLFAGNIWVMWEKLSQFLFSYAMYPIGAMFGLISIGIIYTSIKSKDKSKLIPNILVALLIMLFAVLVLSLPGSLTTGNELAIHQEAIKNTVNLLNNGINEVKSIQDPVGFISLKEADEHGSGTRSFFMVSIILLLIGILFYTFKPTRRK